MYRKAFTLIELLVVIAIIAILAAILFPVFAQAKSAAKSSADLSNIKQLALAGEMWKADHDGNLVKAFSNYESGGQLTGLGYPFGGWDVALQPYIKNKDIFTSPLDPGLRKHGKDTDATTVGYSCMAWDDASGYCADWRDTGPIGARHTDDDFGASYRLNSSNQPGWTAADPSVHFRVAANESSIDQLSSLILFVPGGFGPPKPVGEPPAIYHEVTTADAGFPDSLACIDATFAVDFDRTSRLPKNVTTAQKSTGRANYGFGDGHAKNMAWGSTWKSLGADTKDRNGVDVTPTAWRQNFAGAPDLCKYREGAAR